MEFIEQIYRRVYIYYSMTSNNSIFIFKVLAYSCVVDKVEFQFNYLTMPITDTTVATVSFTLTIIIGSIVQSRLMSS